MPNITESDLRKSEHLNTSANVDLSTVDRDKFISQINLFAEKNKDGAAALIDRAIEKYREMSSKYQGLQILYLDLVYEVIGSFAQFKSIIYDRPTKKSFYSRN